MLTIDQFSISTVPIEMFFNDTLLSSATGFVWRTENDHFLISNWHNVSGKDPNTGKHLSVKTAAEPNMLLVWWPEAGQKLNRMGVPYHLRDSENAPLWLVHPKFGRQIDVVALPIKPTADLSVHPICDMPQEDLQVSVGMEVFILGYPYGITQGGLPVWKRASIATEPALPGSGHGRHDMLLDTASRPGMSGSPIIRRVWGTASMSDGSMAMFDGSATKFIGVYSGRLATSDTLDAQLGIAWPAHFIDQILAGNRRDDLA